MTWPQEFADAPPQAKIALVTLALALAVSAYTDVRQRRILNAVTYPALLVVAACLLSLGGPSLLLESAVGALVCTAPLALAMWRGWMGAGDVKLMAIGGLVSGAAAGWPFSLAVLLDVALAGGVLALSWMLAARAGGHRPPTSVPYGVAIAAGTAWAFLMGAPLF
jgi:prepilin peptidase CpaA